MFVLNKIYVRLRVKIEILGILSFDLVLIMLDWKLDVDIFKDIRSVNVWYFLYIFKMIIKCNE